MDKKNSLNMQPVIAYNSYSTYPTRNRTYQTNGTAVTVHNEMEKDVLNAAVNAHEYHHNFIESHKRNPGYTNGGTPMHQHQQQLEQLQNHNAKIKATQCSVTPFDQLQAVHAKATTVRSKNEEAINDLRTRIPDIERIFDIHNRIGNGTFSTVLLATLKQDKDLPLNIRRQFAIKHHIPTSHPDRIMKELECMAKIGGQDNVVGIDCCLRSNESVAFVMPYLPHDRFHDFFQKMDVPEVQFYMKNLLIALRHVHRFNVIHRDVKPSNFLYNRKRKQFLLVDFGLAQQVPQRLYEQQQCPHIQHQNHQHQQHQHQHQSQQHQINSCLPSGQQESNNNLKEKISNKRLREDDSTGKVMNGDLKTNTNESECVKRVKLNGMEQSNEAGGNCVSFKMPLKQINEIQQNHIEGNNTVLVKQKDNSGIRAAGGACSAANVSNPTNMVNGNTNEMNNNGVGNKYNTNRNSVASQNVKCNCYGNPQVCNICLVKKEVYASRAGTPGYRPPEVLLKFADQTTAVDIWAAGVIFLSILSSVYPFFKAPNDYMALAEMVTIFGDKAIRKTAFVLDRLVTLSQKSKPLDLRKLCVRFRNRHKFSSPEMLRKYQRPNGTCEVCNNCDQYFYNCLCAETPYKTEPYEADDIFPPSAYDLLNRLLEVNPHKRITAEEALQHPFITETYYSHACTNMNLPSIVPNRTSPSHLYHGNRHY